VLNTCFKYKTTVAKSEPRFLRKDKVVIAKMQFEAKRDLKCFDAKPPKIKNNAFYIHPKLLYQSM